MFKYGNRFISPKIYFECVKKLSIIKMFFKMTFMIRKCN